MTRPLVLLLGTWLALLLLFATWPGLDPAISALFYDHATQSFPLQQHERLATLRAVLWNGTYLVAAVVLVLGAQSVLSRRPSEIPGRFWAFAATYVVLGPIILVDQLLKDHWGRARPAETSLFGGNAQFTPPWQITDQCVGNCSFVSGEAASMAAAAILIGLVLWSSLAPRDRRIWFSALGALVLLTALMRVMKGRHFPSDVLWSVVLMATLAWSLGHLFRLKEMLPQVTVPALLADLGHLLRGFHWVRPKDLRRGAIGFGLRAGRAFLILVLGFVLVSTAIPSRTVEKYGDNIQIALPMAGLGCAVATGQGVQYFGRFLLMTTLLHGTKNALGDLPLNQRPHGGLQGFPSGHTAASFFGAAGLAQHCLKGSPAAQAGVIVAASFVAESRIDAGAHTLVQVIAGAVLGWLTQVLALNAFDRAFQRGWSWVGRRIRAGMHRLRIFALNQKLRIRPDDKRVP